MDGIINLASTPVLAPFFRLITHPLKFKFYLLKNLPAAYFSGLKVLSATPDSCTVSVPFKWFTKNPFGSTYFACLSMAAELSTGILAMANVYQRKPAVSMLVTGVQAKFLKKATSICLFKCMDGGKFSEAVDTAIRTNSPQDFIAHSVGTTENGDVVAEFWITWSFKARA